MSKSLRAWRTERLLSVRRLAELAGASNKTIVQLENGRQTASFVTIEKISRVLGVEPRDVLEFARAIDARAGVVGNTVALAAQVARPLIHVYCVSHADVLPTLASRLLETGRYGVTLVVGVSVTPGQLRCAQPDIVVLDLDAESTLGLLQLLRGDPATHSVPIVVTGQNGHLEGIVADLDQPGVPPLVVAKLDQDARELLAAVESVVVSV
jgi:transcriptional regulator with XRE-family HTH domain